MNHAGSFGHTNADAVLPDSPNEDFYMDHPGPSAPSNDDGLDPLSHNSPIMMEEDFDEAYGQSILCCSMRISI